jgi:hypothetical protein
MARRLVTRHLGDPARTADLLARLETVPELARWLVNRHLNGDGLDPFKVLTLAEFAAEAGRRPELLRHLGLTLTHFGLARLVERLRRERPEYLPGSPGGVEPPRVNPLEM